MDNTDVVHNGISPELDELSSTLMGDALDLLAEGESMGVLLVIQEARSSVRKSRHAQRYALTYVGAIQMEDGTFAEALILEFGERGYPSFSAYSLFEGRGKGSEFRWTDPAPAGEEEPLLG